MPCALIRSRITIQTKSSVLEFLILEVTRNVGYDVVWKRDIHSTDWNLKRSALRVLGVAHERKAPRRVLLLFAHSNYDRNPICLESPEENRRLSPRFIDDCQVTI